MQGRVTIGVPTFNRSLLATRAIKSALSQTYPDIEVLVSDDTSSDGTLERIQAIQDPRLVLVAQQKRLGLVANFDYCLRNATGEFFLLLGDDDVLLPNAIEKLVEPFLRPVASVSPEAVGLVWCPCQIADADSSQFWNTEAGPLKETPSSFLKGLFAGHRGPRLSSILIRTEDSIAAGGYQQRYGDLCDIGNYGAAALRREYVFCVATPAVQYTNHHGSTTSQSAVRRWQDYAYVVHQDLLQTARTYATPAAVKDLQASKRNFISGITLTILIQTIGKPGWLRNAVREVLRKPGIFLTPYMFRRFWKDGWKVLHLRQSSKQARQVAKTAA